MNNMIKRSLLTISASLVFATAQADNPFTPDSQPTGWLSTPVVSDFDVADGTQHFFRVGFYKDTWSGNVFSHDINANGVINATTGPWGDVILKSAATQLDQRDWDTSRKIATRGGPFRWANLTAAEKAALGDDEDVLKYVRGDRTNEEPNGKSWRNRESVMGDILHSNVVLWHEDGNKQTVFVGANDGMLHAINAANGYERWAYVPSMVIPNLAALKTKPYVHTHYVDGSISIANVNVEGADRTYLAGALGAGGKGLYALDVTTTWSTDEDHVAARVLWEITPNASFPDLGYTYSKPQFARLPNGTAVVIFGSGYMSDTGKATLYVVNATTGALIKAISTNSGTAASPNGLSSPTLWDTTGDGKPELAYAGDLDGNMWKFDLVSGTASKLYTTNPAQSITSAPAVSFHPLGGQMVNFATGRMLSTGDKKDSSVHYVYGIWDSTGSSAGSFSSMLTQTVTQSSYGSVPVMTASANTPNWSVHKGWKVALRPGERVVGESPFYNAGRFYFITHNPIEGTGINYLFELIATTGGSPLTPIFDLNKDGSLGSADLAANGKIPIAKFLGSGIFSQPRLIRADGFTTTLFVFHPDLPLDEPEPPDPGVSGGHFDYDIFYHHNISQVTEPVPTGNSEIVQNVCAITKEISSDLDTVSDYCVAGASDGYTLLSDYIVGSECLTKDSNYHDLTCSETEIVTYFTGDYAKVEHTHEYDDDFDVTGVNMLNASDPIYNLPNAIPDVTTPFKVLLMNQYLNPAVEVAIGSPFFVNAKDYAGQTRAPNAETVLEATPTYTRQTLANFIFNLPLDAFANKDWWGDGGELRAGLIPTQTGCVNTVNTEGVQDQPGPNGERFNGSFTFQLIRANTPPGHLEINGTDARYGWRVKAEFFNQWVLAEYLGFWHHPNGECYDDPDWIPDPPQDFSSDGDTSGPPPGTADPRGGTFGLGLAIINIVTNTSQDGMTVTTVYTYNDGTTYLRRETQNEDGSITVYQVFRDGSTETTTFFPDSRGGEPGYIDPNTGSPIELEAEQPTGRQSWRDIID